MPKYNSSNVPPKNTEPEPNHLYFERQNPSDLFTEWKYNAVIDNLIVLLQQFPAFYISGVNVTVEELNESGNYCVYRYSSGLVSCRGLVYVSGGTIQTPYNGQYVLRISGSTGLMHYIDVASYSYDYDLINNFCKIAYVCKGGIQYARQDIYSFLLNLPISEARYDALTYFGGYGVYQ